MRANYKLNYQSVKFINPQDVANEYLKLKHEELGIDKELKGVKLINSLKSGSRENLYFEQYYNEIPIYGTEIIITVDTCNTIIILNDLRAYNYKGTYVTDSGIFEFKNYQLNTYKGYTNKGEIVRFTVDDNEFSGIIIDDKNYVIIEPVRKFIPATSKDLYLCYKNKDIVRSDLINSDSICDWIIVNDSTLKSKGSLKADLCTYYLEIATDADFEFYQDMGSDVISTYTYIFSILNIIEGVYESTFDLRFVVTFQNVWNTSSDPYTSTVALDLLREFRREWYLNRTGVNRDLAHLFTGRTLDSNECGAGYIGLGLDNNYGYALSKFRTEMFETTAHEIGHNINATENPSDGHCGTDTASVMCQLAKDNNLWFSSISINEISPFLSDHSSDLANPMQQQLVLSGSINGFNEFQARINITSTQIIESGYTVYKSDEVILNNGFEAQMGCEFETISDDNGCD